MTSAEKQNLPKDGSIDAGLMLLEMATPAGTTRTLDEIAYACGCHHNSIFWIEKQALKKLRRELERRGYP